MYYQSGKLYLSAMAILIIIVIITITIIITIIIVIIIPAIGLSPGGSGYFTCTQI